MADRAGPRGALGHLARPHDARDVPLVARVVVAGLAGVAPAAELPAVLVVRLARVAGVAHVGAILDLGAPGADFCISWGKILYRYCRAPRRNFPVQRSPTTEDSFWHVRDFVRFRQVFTDIFRC